VDILQTFHQKSDTFGAIFGKLGGARRLVSSKRDTGELRTWLQHFLNRRLAFLFDRIIVVADAVADAFARSEGLDRRRMIKIYNGVDTNLFAPPMTPEEKSEAKTAAGFDGGDFIVGMVAGFRPEKDYAMFFESMLEVMSDRPNVRVLAVGGGPLLAAFRSRSSALGKASRIRFTGDVADVRPLLRAMDVGCLVPSSNEGFSNSVIEKMAVGLPMVVTNVGGNAEAVVEGENGWVIAPRDMHALSAVIKRLHDDPELRRSMGQASRRLAQERFSLETMCRQHEELYASVLA
jgi:glycosyltransferase involved in cell wall biosynthesis